MVRDACSLTDADKLRAAGSEAGGVKFDWEREERENSPPGKTQDFPLLQSGNWERRPTSAFGRLLSLALIGQNLTIVTVH